MEADNEVIDVEAFHENLQRRSLEELERKIHRLKVENKDLDMKAYHLNRANDSLSHKLFEQDQRRYEFARRLGFDSMESAEKSITQEDPWVPGGRAALSEAHARILLLEDELAKHITASTEALSVITETNEQLEETRLSLCEAVEDVARLREERNLAREEAERQAMDANAWRIEVQTILPEMQRLILEQQRDNRELHVSRLTASSEKEDLCPGRFEHTSSPLREPANTTLPKALLSSPSPVPTLEAQRYKQQLQHLEAQYKALLETKQNISKKFYEQLMKWKKFKRLVKEKTQSGGRLNMPQRILRRRKGMKKNGSQLSPQSVDLDDIHIPAVQDDTAAIPQDILVNPPSNGSMSNIKGTADQLPCHSIAPPPWFSMKFEAKDLLAPPPSASRSQQSLTQSSSVSASQQPIKTDLRQAPGPSTGQHDPFVVSNHIPLSQQSLTQPSSSASLSPVRAPENMLHEIPQDVARPMVLVVDSPPREATTIKQENLSIEIVETPPHIATSQSTASSTSVPETPIRNKTPHTSAKVLLQRQRLGTTQPISEPPPFSRIRYPGLPSGQAIRRTSTLHTPQRTSVQALKRHHSSPVPSQHLNLGKRKASDIEESSDEDGSDPFKAELSFVPVTAGQTRDEKLAHLKKITKKSHKAYMAEYMQFKGRGRYSSANTAASKTINGEFEIDRDKNSGLGFQYDAIVRDKDERRGLEAGDCECCRDYYEAIGPLPHRLQAPLWKSPSSSSDQRTARPCRYENKRNPNNTPTSSPSTKMHTKAVDAHKQSISRHRHNWAPPNTPPDFWEIEFPDTPTVHDINRRADQMHAHKFGRIESEANSTNGRYRKRK